MHTEVVRPARRLRRATSATKRVVGDRRERSRPADDGERVDGLPRSRQLAHGHVGADAYAAVGADVGAAGRGDERAVRRLGAEVVRGTKDLHRPGEVEQLEAIHGHDDHGVLACHGAIVPHPRPGGNDKLMTITATPCDSAAVAEIIRTLSLLPTRRRRIMVGGQPSDAEGAMSIRTSTSPTVTCDQAVALDRGAAWRFGRHCLEMVAAMVVGMFALGAISRLVIDLPDRTAVRLVEMAIWMTTPMVAWMRVRGHGWRATNEMAAAMLLPAAGALGLLGAGVVTDGHTLLMLEHTVMFLAMFVAMLLRRDEYTGHHAHSGGPGTAA